VGDPWVFREALSQWHEIPFEHPDSEERARWLEDYSTSLFSNYNERRALTRLRKHGVKAARRFPRIKHYRSLLAEIGSRVEAEKAISLLRKADSAAGN
jgi:tRNA-dihydrouridine synthase